MKSLRFYSRSRAAICLRSPTQRPHFDPTRSGGVQRPRRFSGRRAGGEHIINETDRTALDISAGAKGTLDVAHARLPIAADLRCSLATALDQMLDRKSEASSSLTRQQCGLIVAALDEPPRMQRDWSDDVRARPFDGFKERSQRARQLLALLVYEGVNRLRQCPSVKKWRAREDDWRGPIAAGPAASRTQRGNERFIERYAADRTARGCRHQRLCALRAERLGADQITRGAARRKNEREDSREDRLHAGGTSQSACQPFLALSDGQRGCQNETLDDSK